GPAHSVRLDLVSVRPALRQGTGGSVQDERPFLIYLDRVGALAAHDDLRRIRAWLENEVVFERTAPVAHDDVHTRIETVIANRGIPGNIRAPLRCIVAEKVVVASWQLFETFNLDVPACTFELQKDIGADHGVVFPRLSVSERTCVAPRRVLV